MGEIKSDNKCDEILSALEKDTGLKRATILAEAIAYYQALVKLGKSPDTQVIVRRGKSQSELILPPLTKA